MKSRVIVEDINGILSEFEDYLTSLSGKSILITGGNGFIGSYIADTFVELNRRLKDRCKLVILNKNKVNEYSRLSHLVGEDDVEFIEQDVGKPFEVPLGIDTIFHAASFASPTSFIKNPLATIDSNVNGTRNLLEYSKDNSVENFLFFSSADVYGNPTENFIPTPENYNGNVDPTHPRSCYSESKRFSETLCSTFFKTHNVPTKILRIGHTYGPGLREDKAIQEFFYKSIEHNEINLKDGGLAMISHCYISDAIRGIFSVMFNGKSGEAYNIGGGFPGVSIRDLASLIGRTMDNGTRVNPNYSLGNDSSGDYVRWLDISKLKSLGFEPRVPLDVGIQRLKEHILEERVIKVRPSK